MVTSDDRKLKAAFARRLLEIRRERGWNQSDMHRASGLKRQQISTYMRAKALPNDASLTKLAQALGMRPEDLLPERAMAAAGPVISMNVSPDGKKMHINVDVWVPSAVGAQIIALLTDATAHGD